MREILRSTFASYRFLLTFSRLIFITLLCFIRGSTGDWWITITDERRGFFFSTFNLQDDARAIITRMKELFFFFLVVSLKHYKHVLHCLSRLFIIIRCVLTVYTDPVSCRLRMRWRLECLSIFKRGLSTIRLAFL